MTSEDPTVALARMDGRLVGIERELKTIRETMATSEGGKHLAESVSDLRDALASERTERLAGDIKVAATVEKLADRQQAIEDKQESRKYQASIAIALAILGPFVVMVVNSFSGAA